MRNVSCTRSLPICCRCARTPHSADCSKQQSLWQLWYKATLHSIILHYSLRTWRYSFFFFFSPERLPCHPFGECRICWWGACINFRLLLTDSWAEVLDGLSEARAVSWWALVSPCRVPEDPDSRDTFNSETRARARTFSLLSFFSNNTRMHHLNWRWGFFFLFYF